MLAPIILWFCDHLVVIPVIMLCKLLILDFVFLLIFKSFCYGFAVIYTINTEDLGNLDREMMPSRLIDLTLYGLDMTNKTSVSFKVKGEKDIAIFVTESFHSPNPGNGYSFYIGGHYNEWSDVGDIRNGLFTIRQRVFDIYANANYSKPFWFSWKNGMLRGGNGEVVDQQTFISWDDPNPLDIHGIGIGTYWGATGEWKIKMEVKDKFSGHFSSCLMSNTRSDLPMIGRFVTSKVLCAAKCAIDDYCFGFNYTSSKKRCELLSFGDESLTTIKRSKQKGSNFHAKCYDDSKVCVGCFF